MGQGKKPNAARDHAHAHRRAHRLAAKRLSLCIILGTFGVLALVPASAHAITMTKPEKADAGARQPRTRHARAGSTEGGPSLERASRSHSCEMLRREYFSHSSYNGESFAARLRRFGYTTSGCRSLDRGRGHRLRLGSGQHGEGPLLGLDAQSRASCRDPYQVLSQRRRRQGRRHVQGRLRLRLLHAGLRSANPLIAPAGTLPRWARQRTATAPISATPARCYRRWLDSKESFEATPTVHDSLSTWPALATRTRR